MKLEYQASAISKQSDIALVTRSIFWQQWRQYQDCLYRCCVKWMGGNPMPVLDIAFWDMGERWRNARFIAIAYLSSKPFYQSAIALLVPESGRITSEFYRVYQ
jgi:hypothetical protein